MNLQSHFHSRRVLRSHECTIKEFQSKIRILNFFELLLISWWIDCVTILLKVIFLVQFILAYLEYRSSKISFCTLLNKNFLKCWKSKKDDRVCVYVCVLVIFKIYWIIFFVFFAKFFYLDIFELLTCRRTNRKGQTKLKDKKDKDT